MLFYKTTSNNECMKYMNYEYVIYSMFHSFIHLFLFMIFVLLFIFINKMVNHDDFGEFSIGIAPFQLQNAYNIQAFWRTFLSFI